jgi:Zn-dependent peptidase ImmA (M78 family)
MDFKELINEYKVDDSCYFNELEKLFENVPVTITPFKMKAAGFAIDEGIFINENIIGYASKDEIAYLLLHELGHYKRINRFNNGKTLNEFIESISQNFDSLFDCIITEEIVAERYGLYCFRKLSGRDYHYWTQDLHIIENQDKYKPNVRYVYNSMNDSDLNYSDFMKKSIA